MTKQTLAIIGCGWLGKKLIPILKSNFTLAATTAHRDTAKQLPIPAYAYDWTEQTLPSVINKFNHVLIAIPPNASLRTCYPQYMADLASSLTVKGHIIMISSTSVYPQQPGHYDEASNPDRNSIVLQAEQALRQHHPSATILRCGGLIGADRIPGKKWFGQICDLPDQHLNLIHHHDIAKAVLNILLQKPQGKTYNLVHPDHISRHDYYRLQAQRNGSTSPHFTNSTINPDRIIDASLITRELSFNYEYVQLATYP